MKENHNDYSTRSVKILKRININKKDYFSKQNNSDINFAKLKCIKNIKKNINSKLNEIKKEKLNLKKSLNSKKYLKSNRNSKSNSNDNKTILSKNVKNSQKRNIIISKSKINLKIKNNISKNKKNLRNYNSDENKKNSFDKSVNNISNEINKSKLINCLSTATGLSISNEKDKYIILDDSEKNNHKHNYNIDTQSIEKNNILIEENKENINNFCYETISKEDSNENRIILKCENYSLLTFGNSFSYSNSQKSKSTKKYFNNDNKKNKDINVNNNDNKSSCFNLISQYNLNNNYVIKLKEENEILKKELKESSKKISLLINQIKELRENNNFKTKINLNNKNIKYLKMKDKDKIKINLKVFDKENYNSCNFKENEKMKYKINWNNKLKKKNFQIKNDNKIHSKKSLKIGKIKINKRSNLNKKKLKNEIVSTPHFEKSCEKINECISKIII